MPKHSLRKRQFAIEFATLVLVLVATATFAFGQQSGVGPAPPTTASPAASATPTPALRIAAGDLLAVDVFDTPELSAKLRVSENGEINLPVAGRLQVGGLTAEEAVTSIQNLLRDENILKQPHVEVFVQEYATQGVSILGEVKNPGVYPNLGSHTLLDFISVAGGITPTAGKAVIISHKDDPEHPVIVQLDSGADATVRAEVEILPGDTIRVSRSGIVYVVGDVGKPGGFLIESGDHLTALQAIALAQGTNKTAALNATRLIRKTPSGPQETLVKLKAILQAKKADLRLEDGDILFVPLSKGKVVAFQGIISTVGLISGLAIYGRL